MLAEYHASPDDRLVSLPLETNSTKFVTSLFSVGQEKLQNNKHDFRNLQTIMKHIKNIINSENRKEMLSDIKTLFEHLVQATDINVQHDYLHSVYNNTSVVFPLGEEKRSTCLFFLITYHVLVMSENENSTQILNVIKDKLLLLRESEVYFCLDCINQLYLDVYYKDNPNDIFTNIHTIWKCDKATELKLKLVYCKNLMEDKNYKTLIQLIHNHADNLIESFEENEHKQCKSSTAIMVLLHVLHYQISLNKMERVKTIATILSRLSMSIMLYDEHVLLDGFYDFLLTLDNKQLPVLCSPYVIKLLQSLMKEHPFDYLRMILLSIDRLRQANHYTECIEFIKSNFQFISSFPTVKLKIHEECYYRQQYCITLLLLLNEYVTCYDTHKINLMLTKLLDFRVSFLSDIQSTSCYCFMGNKECMTVEKHLSYLNIRIHGSIERSINMTDFKQHLLDIYKRTYCSKITRSSKFRDLPLPMDPRVLHRDYDLKMNNVIQGELQQTSYLKSIIEMMEINKYKNESVVSFIEFIVRSTDYNVKSLYNIIKILCAFELKPEIQDMILQGVTEYLMISCNKQYGLLSKFILDINMSCPKDQFLHKLTSGIAKSLLKFDDDTVKDFNNLIYKCYCTVRHDCRDEKDKNIKKYKDHFTFIASMEAEEEMKKLTSLTNFLLMLTLLLIASGGHHKSAELKKYLSLKYEYEDSILYLLWCSGDVEINPGPTLSTLRKVPDSVKERSWIYEMCSIQLRLLKYKSIDTKNGGLWKEKLLHWPTDWPLYDPRNKPKGQGYNTDTDKKLLTHLVKYCYEEGVFKDTTQVNDKPQKSQLKQYQEEITAWQNDKNELFALYILRKVQDTLRAAKGSLHNYRDDPELQQCLNHLDLILIFDSGEVSNVTNQSYTDMLRDIAITLCRIAKRLNILEKSDGIWKTKPIGWNPNHPFYSPCNAGKGKKKDQYKQLVNNLLAYCESKNITIPSELQQLLKAWKQKKTSEITKSYTIWSKTAIVKHSLQFLELEGLLGKIHVQESLKQIGVILDTQHWRCPSVNVSCTSDNDDKSQDSGSSDNLPSSPSSDKETHSTAKIASIQINSDNPSTELSNSTQTNTKDTPASSLSLVCHTDGHLCNVAPDQQYQRNQSSKYTCVNSFKDSCPILASEAQPEADGNYQPISSVNSSTSKGEVIPCTVHIHDATSKTDSNNKISKTAKKRGKQKNDESPTEPKLLHISEEDDPLLLHILTSLSENGKALSYTRRKDGDIIYIVPNQFPHDLISKKQTDQLVVKDLTYIASDKPENSSISNRKDGEISKANKNKTTSDQYVDKIVDLLEELDQHYSSTLVEGTIPISCSSTDQSEDSRNELPEPIKLYVDTYLNSYNPDDKLETDIEQFIEEQGMDSS